VAKVIAVSSWTQADERAYTVCKEGGLDVLTVVGITDECGSIDLPKAVALGRHRTPSENGSKIPWQPNDRSTLRSAA